MAGLARIELPASGTEAARVCLAARRPASDPAQLRMTARRAIAIADELRDAGSQLLSAADSAIWSGAAAEAFSERLRSSAPSISVTAQRYDSYAQALLGYAAAVDDAGPVLRSLAGQLAGEIATTTGPAAAPAVGGASLADRAQALAVTREADARDQVLLALARRFVIAHDQWADAVAVCVAGIRRANLADPTRDLHGWLAWEHRLRSVAHYVDPVLDFVRRPSWQSASNALSWLSSNLTVIAMAAMLLCPVTAAVCLTIVAVLSAAQLAVDGWRKWGAGEQVSTATLIIDGLGVTPVGRLAEGGRVVTRAGRQGWASESGVRRIGAAGAAGAAGARRVSADAAGDLAQHPTRVFAPGLSDVPGDFYRSTSYGGSAALARRWQAPLLWDGSNAVLGLPQVAGGTSTPQYLWSDRGSIGRKTEELSKPLRDAAGNLADGLRSAATSP